MKRTLQIKTLVVEDESLIRRNISRKITELNPNFIVIGEAMNGLDALKIVESETPQLVVTDIQMPMMNGLELAKNIFFAFPHIKIVILSGYHEFEYARRAINYKVEDYLLKPVTDEKLHSLLGKIELKIRGDLDSLANIASSMSDKTSPEELVEAVKLFIKENYKKNLTLKEIANELNFTVDYLGKIFRKHTNETPIKYLTRLRINEAKRILSTDLDMEIKTVGKIVGYQDPYYFSRVFKTNTGYYPSEYRALKHKTE
ncbi:response regulator [Paenactinomyces guangxiensis]|uniref:Response regulator n=1 Tax=Paenactinomyces guangxiensis TaxID=1490290 RepID=A0A7W1WPS7_9BACL|nr:response regulator [Paenactinomyces guangxiensis]MBA4493825.1 response regulator [Paenactinomyces guangxiensis]MBH8591291.1 response regulator [Paenactinomyces guangxiensis]